MKYIIYGISVGDYTYIGSTKDFKQRKIRHKSNCTNYNCKVYQMIREAGGWDKCEMVPIEEFECEGQLQARIREEHWRRLYNPNMNSYRAHITEEDRKEREKEYYLTPNICECGGRYTNTHKPRHEKSKKHQDYLERQNLTI
jgi:hypothetical protein